MTQYDCQICGRPADEDDSRDGDEDGGPWFVEDDYALYSGYNLRLGHDDETSPAICGPCARELGTRGSTYVVAGPQYPDDPEAGDIRTVSATVDHGVLSTGGPRHEEVEPESPEFRLIEAWENDLDLPTDWFEQFWDIDDGDEWEQIGTGWYSSLEKSDLSDAVNAITNGELGIYGPVIVKFGETNNVCTVGLTVYAPTGLEVWSKEEHGRVSFRDYLRSKSGVGAFS